MSFIEFVQTTTILSSRKMHPTEIDQQSSEAQRVHSQQTVFVVVHRKDSWLGCRLRFSFVDVSGLRLTS